MEKEAIASFYLDSKVPEYFVSLKAEESGSFADRLKSVEKQYRDLVDRLKLDDRYLVSVRIFLSDYVNQQASVRQSRFFAALFRRCAVSVVEQAPLDGTKINVLLHFVVSDEMVRRDAEGVFLLEQGRYLHIFQSVVADPVSCKTVREQTREAFLQHTGVLSKYHFNLKDNTVRTWIYLRDVDKDYAEMISARNEIFGEFGLTSHTHFIASTGIEGKSNSTQSGIQIDFYSVGGIGPDQLHYLRAPEYLNDSYEYGASFERGTAVTYPDKKHIFISGTASIDPYGNCIHQGDVVRQADRVFLNIEKLLSDARAGLRDIAQMIVYLRDLSDYRQVADYLGRRFGDVPKVIVQGRVCRPEWLIEVECIAVTATLSSGSLPAR